MRAILCWTALVASCLVLPSCVVEAENPLSDPSASRHDPSLCGLWSLTRENGNVTYLHIGAARPKAIDTALGDSVPGLMRCWSVNHNANNHQMSQPFEVQFFTSQIGDEFYGNLIRPSERAGQKKPTSFWFFKYRVTDHRLELSGTDWKAAAKIVENGQLQGVVREVRRGKNFRWKRVLISDTTETLERFLLEGGDEILFPDRLKTVWERVK